MDVNVKEINGAWTLGYSLDKHTLSSKFTGYNQYGHPEYDTVRTTVGEALFQLKYRNDFSKVSIISTQLYTSLWNLFPSIDLIIPMPPSKKRMRQPVTEIAKEFARLTSVPFYENLLVKTGSTSPMKDIELRDDKVAALMGVFAVNDVLIDGKYNVLIVDDLFDTGSSLEAATNVLNKYRKTDNVYTATVTRIR